MQRRDERLAELDEQLWAMEPTALRAWLATVEARLAGSPFAPQAARPAYSIDEHGTATIALQGVLLNRVPDWAKGWGDVTDMGDARRAIEAAAADPAVRSIALAVDSPGGTVAGTAELADAYHAAGAMKPTRTHASGMMASAAYWVGAQGREVGATPSTSVGSIGVFRTMVDASKYLENDGIKVHVLSSHELKGAGVWGAPVTPNQLADAQASVDRAAQLFVEGVARGRRTSPTALQPHATGQTWFAADAHARGLIDIIDRGMTSAGATAAGMTPTASTAPEGAPESEVAMSDNKPAAQADVQNNTAAQLAEALAAKAKLEAKNEAMALALAEQKKAQIAAVINAHATGPACRVTPSLRPAVEKFAATCETTAELEAFIKDLPVQTHGAAQGHGGTEPAQPQAGAVRADAKPGSGQHPDDVRIASLLGINPADMAKHPSGTAISPGDRSLVRKNADGSYTRV